MTAKQDVADILAQFRGSEPLKNLFWSTLEYDRVNQALSRRNWPAAATEPLADDPVLLASSGENGDFHVIYSRLKSPTLKVADERPIVSRLLQDHPYALFVFSNAAQDRWHFVNVRYDKNEARRRVFRRITVGPEERLRTAAERLAMLDLSLLPSTMFSHAPLEIQKRHDDAFDVEAVTRRFYEEYDRVFRRVEQQITGLEDQPERRRLFTQRLFNRLMFIAFIQKKGWLKLGSSPADYLSELWKAYRRAGDGTSFYDERLKLLFFFGLNRAATQDLALAQGNDVVASLIGRVPYLNGGLFEQDEDDLNERVSVPDEAISPILTDLFGRFNFTVTESTPLDVEVAVDPEMLGKVFEELVTGRHESGSYYTPKPVVSFMCREALKGYLETALPAEKPATIAHFVDEHAPQDLRDPEKALEALKRVRVCDPACGSGAYLLGMLHELLDLRACLFATRQLDPVSVYQRKLEIIQQNVYGVDIDPFAINIARLRLWLSLAVEFEGDQPPPLPNLDFKIEVGDSLTAPDPSGGLMMDMFRQQQITEYFGLKADYLEAHGELKRELRSRIETIRREISEWAHPKGGIGGFDWQVQFAEVFDDGGFDVVMANPPYVRQELISALKPALKNVFPAIYNGTSDLYCYFYARALQILRKDGALSFISPNKWFRANYGGNLRKHIAETCRVRSITDFGDLPVFQAATTYPMIFVAQKGHKPDFPTTFTQVKSLEDPYPDVLAVVKQIGQVLPNDAISSNNWNLANNTSSNLTKKMKASGVTLKEYVKGQIYRGLLTGLNEAFIINDVKKAELVHHDANSIKIIKPLAMGKDIRKWSSKDEDKWLIVTEIGVDIKNYPTILNHLKQWQVELEKRWDKGKHWWELRACSYYDAFNKPKIIFPDIAKNTRFAFNTKGTYLGNTAYMIPVHDLFLLGVLNSKSVEDFYIDLSSQVRGGYLRFIRQYVEQIPIPNATPAEKAVIAALAQKCLDAKGVGCEVWEGEINERVAKLYGL